MVHTVLADTILPEAISDHTVTLKHDNNIIFNNIIYNARGCNDVNGDVYNEEAGIFACTSTASGFYSFDPSTREIMTLPDMPRSRYRRAATSINNQIWLVGGRDVMDLFISEVDVSTVHSCSIFESICFHFVR